MTHIPVVGVAPAGATNIARLIAAARVGRVQARVTALCPSVVLLDGLDLQIVGSLGPPLAETWHLSAPELGCIFSLGLLGMMAGLRLTNVDATGTRMSVLRAEPTTAYRREA